jgi:hypothetical protein
MFNDSKINDSTFKDSVLNDSTYNDSTLRDSTLNMCTGTVAEAGGELLRVDLSLLSKRGEPEEDPRLLLKILPARASSSPPPLRVVSRVSSAFQSIIYILPPPSST